MNLVKYNSEFGVNPVGFNNNGVICYFNSVLQSLLSCTSFVEKIENNTDTNNPMIKFLKELLYLHTELNKLLSQQKVELQRKVELQQKVELQRKVELQQKVDSQQANLSENADAENADAENASVENANIGNEDAENVSIGNPEVNDKDASDDSINDVKDKIQNMSILLWKVMVLVNKKKNKDFSFNGQQCASEGFNHLLGSIDEFSGIKNLFMHRYNTNLYCFDCSKWVSSVNNVSNVFVVNPELYMHQLDEFKQFDTKENNIFNELYNIDNLSKLNKYIIKQNSFVDKDYKCPKCNKKGEKYKLNYLVMIPEILVIMSKKYDNNLRKKEVLTEFPETLVFSGNNNNILTYTAVSQIEHSGNLNSGHYWSISKRRDGKWYMLNDSSVSESEFSPTKKTYMVFYHIVTLEK